ncbi:MAG: phosphoribosylanthranilate isomerase [Thermoguttaceae bacterium]|nr:phosphoribosylanthranilate isomerase [Thermoguttaceae bacterium]
MTKIKLCGMTRLCDVDAVNELRPEYVGFVFAPGSKRRVTSDQAAELKARLIDGVTSVGVFVNEPIENVCRLVDDGFIDVVQLHGSEDEAYISRLRERFHGVVIQAFKIRSEEDVLKANRSSADFILLDSGAGTGKAFDRDLISSVNRDFFLAGGLSAQDVQSAIRRWRPYAVDVSSAIETNGLKDKDKMTAFVEAVRRQ